MLISALSLQASDLLSSIYRRIPKYLCAVSLESAVTTFASWVHLTWMQSNLGFDLLFGSQGSKCKIKFWDNQGGTSRNCCTQTLVILHAQTHWRTLIVHQKLGYPDLLYWSKSPADKTWREWTFSSQLSFTTHRLLYSSISLIAQENVRIK